MPPCILTGSPRFNGNSDYAASMLMEDWKDALRLPVARMPIAPCFACGYCREYNGICRIAREKDDAGQSVMQALFAAEYSCIVSPIFFYGLPAAMKIFVDRAQAWYWLPRDKKPAAEHKLGVVLISGRSQGEKLFDGSLLTLKYMADALGLDMQEPLLLRGLEGAHALSSTPALHAQIKDYAKKIRESAV